jgi:hypothetical protein
MAGPLVRRVTATGRTAADIGAIASTRPRSGGTAMTRTQPRFPASPILISVLLLCSPVGIAAQQASDTPGHYPIRSGLWFSAGLGTAGMNGDVSGLSGNFVLGGTLNQRVLLGVGSSDWRVGADRSVATIGTLDFRAQFYPEANAGFFLTGGLGLSYFRFDDSGSGPDVGSGIVIGLGYDARVGSNTSITTFINRVGFHTSDPRGNFIQLGVGVTAH